MANDFHAESETDNKVLSFGIEKLLLTNRESVLRAAGFEVLSTTSEGCVRFEIAMGQCGVLFLCHTVHASVHRDLAAVFTNFCNSGVIVAAMHPVRREESPHAHICLLDSELADKIHLIRNFRDGHKKSA